VRPTHVGDLSGAAYDWVDLYFLPVGGRYTLERSGPEIRADVYPATITEPVPTSSEYFALLTHLLRGNRFVEAGDWAKAALELELIQRTPFRMNELVSKAYLYNLSLGLGMIHYRDGSLDAALKDWRIATEIHPSKAVAYFHVGEALRNLGQFEKAAEHYLLALERASGNAHLLHQLGVGFMKMGQFGTSIEILNRAAGLRADADIYVNLGVAYERSDSVDARDRAFRSALELNPGHPQAAQIRQVLESTSRE
jgi:tetratricopeptide (TPR) repeat protein